MLHLLSPPAFGFPLVAAALIIIFLFIIGLQPPESLYILFLIPIALSGRWGVRGGLIGGAVAVVLSALAERINHGTFMTEETAPYAISTWGFFVVAGVVSGILVPYFSSYKRRAIEAEGQLSIENACLAEIGRIITSSLDIGEIYGRFAEQVRPIINFDINGIILLDEKRKGFVNTYLAGALVESPPGGDVRPIAGTFAERILNTGSSLLFHPENRDVVANQFPRHLNYFDAGLRSLLAVPIISKDEIIGVLHFSTIRPNAYTDGDVFFAERIAAQIAGAIANSQLYDSVRQAEEAERQLAKENACLAEIGRIIGSSLDVDEVYERFAGQVSALIPFDRLAITMLDEEQENIRWTYQEGIEVPGMRRGDNLPLEGTLTESVIKLGSSVLFQTEEEDELLRMFPFNLPFFKAGFRSFMAAPLISRDRIIGTLHLRSTTINAYANKDVALAERVADQISGAIANAQLFAKSRETEEALRKSELRFATILDIAEDAIISMDENQTITLFNQGAEKIFGYLADEMIGKSLDFLLPQWAIETHRAHIQMFEAGPEAARTMNDRGEVFGQRKDGVMFPAEASISKLEFDGKKVFTVILRDITARKEAEAVLHESDERFRQVADNIREVFWLFDLSLGRVIYASPAYSEIFGLSPETLYEDPSSWQRIMHHEDVERQQAIFDNPPTEPWHGEFRIWHPDGSLHWISNRAFPIFDEAGKVKRLVGIAEDITERKLAEEAVRESQSRFIQLAENIPDAIWLADPKAGLLYMSPAYENIYGLTLESLSEDPTSWLDAVHPDDRERVRDIRENQAKEDRYYEFRVVHSDGSIRWVSNQRTPILDENGEVYRLIGVAQDITHRKLMEEQLLQAQKMEVVGQLAGGIAHDFNNLLTAILAYSHLGTMKLPPEDPVAGYMKEIRKAGESAAKLTSQLLTFSRRHISEPRVLNLNEITLDTNKMLRRLIGEDIEMVVLPAEELWLTEVDPGQMEQVLVNLTVNARDAMPDGGKLTIETANARIDAGLARLHPDLSEGEYATLSVRDTGTGIPKEVMEHIFEPFFTTKEVGKGTGLGLAMCYGIVKQSGGCITVDSEPDKGTTFTIYLPRVDVPATNLPLRDESGYLPTGSETVLLVEDEPALLNVAAHVLREQGYTVLEATNGTDALRVSEDCADQEIHLLLTDVVMPLMGGKELADKLRLIRPGISVLFASGYTDDAIVSQDILEERTKFMQKPFTPSDLARKVKDTIHAR